MSSEKDPKQKLISIIITMEGIDNIKNDPDTIQTILASPPLLENDRDTAMASKF